jgi:hypothetical protein
MLMEDICFFIATVSLLQIIKTAYLFLQKRTVKCYTVASAIFEFLVKTGG